MAEYPPAETFFPDRKSLTAFQEAVHDCRACHLYKEATQAVFGEGLRRSDLMLVGEQPGNEVRRRNREALLEDLTTAAEYLKKVAAR